MVGALEPCSRPHRRDPTTRTVHGNRGAVEHLRFENGHTLDWVFFFKFLAHNLLEGAGTVQGTMRRVHWNLWSLVLTRTEPGVRFKKILTEKRVSSEQSSFKARTLACWVGDPRTGICQTHWSRSHWIIRQFGLLPYPSFKNWGSKKQSLGCRRRLPQRSRLSRHNFPHLCGLGYFLTYRQYRASYSTLFTLASQGTR